MIQSTTARPLGPRIRNLFCVHPNQQQQETYSNSKWWKPYRQAICVVKAAADGISKALAQL
jgi:hypothetical protein